MKKSLNLFNKKKVRRRQREDDFVDFDDRYEDENYDDGYDEDDYPDEVYPDEETYMDEEVYLDEEESIYYDEVPIGGAIDEPQVEEIYVEHDAEEVIYGDVPVEEVYLDENINDVSSEESVDEEVDESDGWAEYIEEEFGDSVENSQESDDSDE